MLKYHLLRCTCVQHSAQDTRYLSDERAWLGRIETMYSVITKRETTAGYKVKRGLKLVHRFKWKMWYEHEIAVFNSLWRIFFAECLCR